MALVTLILLVFAFVLFIAAAAGVALPRVQLGWAGAAFATLALILSGLPGLNL